MQQRGARFPRAARLTTARHYKAVLRGAKPVASSHFVAYSMGNDLGWARLGMIIPKRYVRCAVQRNLVKRLIRETFRCWSGRCFSLDVVIRVIASLDALSRRAMVAELKELLDQLSSRV